MTLPGEVYTLRLGERSRNPRRLGRHVQHDARSLAYAAPVLPRAAIRSQTWERHAPIWDQESLGSCFPPGTRVRMADGSEQAIEDVRLLERVVTAEGNTGRVVRTAARDEEGGLLRLLLWGHSHLRMTRDHEVLTARGYVAARDLEIGDEVALPRYRALEPNRHVLPADHVTRASLRVVAGNRWQGLPGRKGLSASAHRLPDKIGLDAAFGRLIGLFLAEGNCDSGKAIWSFGAHEIDTLVPETVRLLEQYGVEAHVRQLAAHNTCKVTVHGTAWSRLLSGLCGDGAGLKRLHPDLTAGPLEFIEAVLSGWLDGDGHRRPDGSLEGVTISRALALNMYDIAQAVGRSPVLVRSEPTMNSAAATRRPRWTMTMAPRGGRCRQDDTHVWRKVRQVVLEEYVGPVYDLEVEGDHSYVAEGVGVHNCTGQAAAGWVATDNATRPGVRRVGETWVDEAYAVNLYHLATTFDEFDGTYPPEDGGSSGLGAAKALQSLGLCSGYTHAFSVPAMLTALQAGPVLIGIPWFNSMWEPVDGRVTVDPSSGLAGGHELCVDQLDVDSGYVGFANSWGTGWGSDGRGLIDLADLQTLLADDGDCTVPTPVAVPAGPTPPVPSPAGCLPGLVKRLFPSRR